MRDLYIGVRDGENIVNAVSVYDNTNFSLIEIDGLNALATTVNSLQGSAGGTAFVIDGVTSPSAVSFSIHVANIESTIARTLMRKLSSVFGIVMHTDAGNYAYKMPLVASAIETSQDEDGVIVKVSAICSECGAWRSGSFFGGTCMPNYTGVIVTKNSPVTIQAGFAESGFEITGNVTSATERQLVRTIVFKYIDANEVPHQMVFSFNLELDYNCTWTLYVRSSGKVELLVTDNDTSVVHDYSNRIDWLNEIGLMPRYECEVSHNCPENIAIYKYDWSVVV